MTDIDTILRHGVADMPPLRLARTIRGLSQRDLERLAGLPATTLCHIEAGRRDADPATRARIALALDCDVDLLFGGR